MLLAAEIWYWWIGVVFLVITLIVGVALVFGYMKSVSSQEYPDAAHARQEDL